MNIKDIVVFAPYCFGDSPIRIERLGKVNFIFAPNGCGKTTISNALSQQPDDADKRRVWDVAPTDLPIRVFNEEYRSNVLTESVNGIYTLGEDSKEKKDKIDNLEKEKAKRRAERDSWWRDINSENQDHLGAKQRLEIVKRTAVDRLFDYHKDVPQAVREIVFKGYRNSKSSFFEEVKARSQKAPAAPQDDIDWTILEERAESLFGNQTTRTQIPRIRVTALLSEEEIAEVERPLPRGGKGSLSALIQKLSNEDWVNQGRAYVGDSHGLCPFCQQALKAGFETALADYFSEEFDNALARIGDIRQTLNASCKELEEDLISIEQIVHSDPEIDNEVIDKKINSIRKEKNMLLSAITDKCSHPTKPIHVEDARTQIDELQRILDEENNKINEHNRLLENKNKEKQNLIEDGWRLFLSRKEVSNAIKEYNGKKRSYENLINKLKNNIDASNAQDERDDGEIRKLRDSLTNTGRVAQRINKTLSMMGFTRFRLKVADSLTGGYQIVRGDGTSAFKTLSEGEKSFICFAYYWESLFGSNSSQQNPEEVIAVIDDPISSLDSDSLFLVAAYIREAIDKVINGEFGIQQLIVLTHNTQFHNEAAYSNRQRSGTDCHYYRLTKNPQGFTSVIDDGSVNKIRGTYSLLWDSVVEMAKNENDSDYIRVGIFNVVRRIIERYFKTLGLVKDIKHKDGLSVVERRILATFDMWANAGSHTIFDDIDQTIDRCSVSQFLQLFQDYFILQGQEAHFNMMIKASGGEDLFKAGQLFDKTRMIKR